MGRLLSIERLAWQEGMKAFNIEAVRRHMEKGIPWEFHDTWPYDNAAAYEYGRNFAELRCRGSPMQQVDIQIAAIAMALGNCIVVSKDSDLSSVPGLTVEDWTIPASGSAP